MRKEDFWCARQGIEVQAITDADLAGTRPIEIRHTAQSKRALLCIHGFGATPFSFQDFVRQIQGYDAIFAPLLPGHGESLDAFSKTSYSAWIEAVKKEASRLSAEFDSLDVLGFSLGALLACEVTRIIPVHQLYLLAPAFQLRIPMRAVLYVARCLRLVGFKHWISSRQANIARDGVYDIGHRKLPLSSLITLLEYILTFRMPPLGDQVYVFLGRHDAVVNSEKVAAMLHQKHPMVKIQWLEHAAHDLPMDNGWEEILKYII